MPGVSGVTVVTTLVCFFISHTRLRVHRASGIPCALSRAKEATNLGAARVAGISPRVIASDSEAIQTFARMTVWIASSLTLLAMTTDCWMEWTAPAHGINVPKRGRW